MTTNDQTNASVAHIPVMLEEAVAHLQPQPDQWYVDATFGNGGHTQAILETGAKVVAFDFDQEAIFKGKAKFAKEIETGNLHLIRDNFANIETTIQHLQNKNEVGEIKGILFDFGTSTNQLMNSDRGFSFNNNDAMLDMRMDNRLGVKASDLLKIMSEKQLAKVFREFGGEESAFKIAKAIVSVRKQNPENLDTVGGLVKIIKRHKRQTGKLHPATKVFQGLRIAVNDELGSIEKGVPRSLRVLAPGGRLVTIAFHEGEDRLVKRAMKDLESQGKGKRVIKKTQKPSTEEVLNNPRSRSAQLRVFEKN